MKTLDLIVDVVGVVASGAAAGLWFYASSIDIPNNLDTIVGALKRASEWNAYGAIAAGVAAVCLMITFLRRFNRL